MQRAQVTPKFRSTFFWSICPIKELSYRRIWMQRWGRENRSGLANQSPTKPPPALSPDNPRQISASSHGFHRRIWLAGTSLSQFTCRPIFPLLKVKLFLQSLDPIWSFCWKLLYAPIMSVIGVFLTFSFCVEKHNDFDLPSAFGYSGFFFIKKNLKIIWTRDSDQVRICWYFSKIIYTIQTEDMWLDSITRIDAWVWSNKVKLKWYSVKMSCAWCSDLDIAVTVFLFLVSFFFFVFYH